MSLSKLKITCTIQACLKSLLAKGTGPDKKLTTLWQVLGSEALLLRRDLPDWLDSGSLHHQSELLNASMKVVFLFSPQLSM
jgi:hypothetical protein